MMDSALTKMSAAACSPPPDSSCFMLFGPELQEYHGNSRCRLWWEQEEGFLLLSSIKLP